MIILPIKRKWFDMIKSGEKTEEYRENKPYWTKRIENDKDRIIKFKNGYDKDSETLYANYVVKIQDKGKKEWGCPHQGVFLVFHLFNVREER